MLRLADLPPIEGIEWEAEEVFFPTQHRIAGAFARLRAGERPDGRQQGPFRDLWETVCQQGTPTRAANTLAPYLLALAFDKGAPVTARTGSLRLVAAIVDFGWGNPLNVDPWGAGGWLFCDTRAIVARHRADLLELACHDEVVAIRRSAIVMLGRLCHPDPVIVVRFGERMTSEPDPGARVDLLITICVLAGRDHLAWVNDMADGDDSPLARAAAVMRLHLNPMEATAADITRVLAWHPESDSPWRCETDDTEWDLPPITVLVKALRIRPDLAPPVLDAMRAMTGFRRGQLGGQLVLALFANNYFNQVVAGLPTHDPGVPIRARRLTPARLEFLTILDDSTDADSAPFVVATTLGSYRLPDDRDQRRAFTAACRKLMADRPANPDVHTDDANTEWMLSVPDETGVQLLAERLGLRQRVLVCETAISMALENLPPRWPTAIAEWVHDVIRPVAEFLALDAEPGAGVADLPQVPDIPEPFDEPLLASSVRDRDVTPGEQADARLAQSATGLLRLLREEPADPEQPFDAAAATAAIVMDASLADSILARPRAESREDTLDGVEDFVTRWWLTCRRRLAFRHADSADFLLA